MNNLFRFSDYDIFANIMAGLGVIFAVDVIAGTSFLIGATWTVSDATVTVLCAYVLGHLVASPSSLLLEKGLVGKVLRPPGEVLMSEVALDDRAWWRRRLLRAYHTPLRPHQRQAVRDRADGAEGADLFWKAHAVAQRDPVRYPRMQRFLNLYGFCRNLGFVALTAWLCVIAPQILDPRHRPIADEALWTVGFLVIGLVLLQRYLMFHRLYTVEAFVAFADAPPEGGS